jgi:serine/threonine-protein kinase
MAMAEERPAARILAPGTRLGAKYALVRRLATGGMGEVWLAQNETTHANVALKVLRPGAASKATEAEDRFRREARLAGVLAHRSIVRIFDFLEESDGTLVLVMELLQGETLEQWLGRRGPLPEREAMAVMAAVLSALQHGHEQGVIHRDVKPSNIFLAVESDGKVIPKLLDYGIAKMPKNDAQTMDGVVLGTPSYMSPEQIRSEQGLDGRSDLFSCGVVLYEMITGTCPFEAPTPSAAIASVLQNSVDPDPRIDPLLWLEIQRALSKRPKQRHASAAEMRKAMLGVLHETEDSLAPVLKGVKARDFVAVRTGPVFTPSSRDAETQSVEGQSVALTPQRRIAAWWAWAAVGAIVGSAAMVVAMTQGRPSGAPTPARSIVTATATAVPNLPLPEPSAPPVAVSVESIPATTAPPSSSPNSAPSSTSRPAPTPPPRPARHILPKPHTPKPVATSPGF